MTDGGGSGPAPDGSASEQLRVTPTKSTGSHLMEKSKAAGIGGYSSKRKEEPIDLVICKKPRLLPSDDQVHSAGALDVTGLLGAALCGLCLMLARPSTKGLCVRACLHAYSPVRACVCAYVRVCERACECA